MFHDVGLEQMVVDLHPLARSTSRFDSNCITAVRSVVCVTYSVRSDSESLKHRIACTLDPLVEAGASHIIMNLRDPWKVASEEKLVRWRDSRR
jgi:hypothetical protein